MAVNRPGQSLPYREKINWKIIQDIPLKLLKPYPQIDWGRWLQFKENKSHDLYQ